MLALWQPGYCREELGSAHRCYDAGSLLKGKDIEGKLEMKQRVRGNGRKVQKMNLYQQIHGNYLRFTYFESLMTEDIELRTASVTSLHKSA